MRLFLPILAGCLIASCARLPDTSGRVASHAIREVTGTSLARSVKAFTASHPSESGFHPLSDGGAALDARLGLAAMAERSLDLQYYIWQDDPSGHQMVAALLAAADRGVRVRVLIDDLGTSARDDDLLALDSHRGIEVRLFNPVTTRTARMLGTVFEFGRINRRMHNKAFIADNRVAIVGGRNIGDEYFDAHGRVNFADFDVAAVGPVVGEVSRSFDSYWNCPSSIGITELTRKRATPETASGVRAVLARAKESSPEFPGKLRSGELRFFPGRATVVADDPAKVLASAHRTETHLAPRLREAVGVTKREVLIVSPYFIPGKVGMNEIAALRRQGVRVVVLTNSLASTDVAAVHAGYLRYRKEMLRMGVELYENKPTGGWRLRGPGRFFDWLDGDAEDRASLHAKTFTFDRRKLFVGSLNLDPRSIRLNTELGIVIENGDLARLFTEAVMRDIEKNAYRLTLEGGRLVWTTVEEGRSVRLTREPKTTPLQRLAVGVLSWLPIEGQL